VAQLAFRGGTWCGAVRGRAGFVDPIALLRTAPLCATIGGGRPMSCWAPACYFRPRLMNTGAIQHNLDWIWPYWVERQFYPHDDIV